MTDIEKYIANVLCSVKDKSAKQQIKRELEAHIDDRIEYYTDAGYDIEYAEKMALSKMGEADRLGLQMNSLHNYAPLTVSVIITQILYAVCILLPLIAAVISVNSTFAQFNYSKLMLIQSSAKVLLFTVNFYLSSKLLSKYALFSLGILTILSSFINTVSNLLLEMCIHALIIIDYSEYSDVPHKLASVMYDAYTYIALIMLVVSICYGAYLKNRMNGKSSRILSRRYYSFNYVFTVVTAVSILLTVYVLIYI